MFSDIYAHYIIQIVICGLVLIIAAVCIHRKTDKSWYETNKLKYGAFYHKFRFEYRLFFVPLLLRKLVSASLLLSVVWCQVLLYVA